MAWKRIGIALIEAADVDGTDARFIDLDDGAGQKTRVLSFNGVPNGLGARSKAQELYATTPWP